MLTRDLTVPDDEVDTAPRTADAVFHLAGRPGVRAAGPDTAGQRTRDNVLAGARVLATTPPTTAVVVASSSSVYGGVPSDPDGARPSRETDPLRPRGGYARSKVALERLVALHLARGGCAAASEPDVTLASTDRCRDLLGFAPSTDLDALVRREDIADGLVRAYASAS